MESFNGILVYNYKSEENKIEFTKKILTENCIWDFQFWSQNKLILVQASQENPVILLNIENDTVENVDCDLDFFKGKLYHSVEIHIFAFTHILREIINRIVNSPRFMYFNICLDFIQLFVYISQCGNIRIFLSLRFYVKLTFCKSRVSKSAILHI